MATKEVIVADKPTLDEVKGEIKNNDYGLQSIREDLGVGARLTVVTNNSDLFGKTVICAAEGGNGCLINYFSNTGEAEFVLPTMGRYIVSCENITTIIENNSMSLPISTALGDPSALITIIAENPAFYDKVVGIYCGNDLIAQRKLGGATAALRVYKEGEYTLYNAEANEIMQTFEVAFGGEYVIHADIEYLTIDQEEDVTFYNRPIEIDDGETVRTITLNSLIPVQAVCFYNSSEKEYIIRDKQTSVILGMINIKKNENGLRDDLVELVSFESATVKQMNKILNAYYTDLYSAEAIKKVWKVNQKRTMNLDAISKYKSLESHRSQNIEVKIIDFEKDELVTPIGEHTKALITLTQVDSLMSGDAVTYQENTEKGCINLDGSAVNSWIDSLRRDWLNHKYLNAFQEAIRNSIKQVKKKTSIGNGSSQIVITEDYIFFASEVEVTGETKYSYRGEGQQYAGFKSKDNRLKKPEWNSTNPASIWWTRSPQSARTPAFCYINNVGTSSYAYANENQGIAPCFCM